MHVFMTGVSGYIGGSVARKLLDAGHRVSGLVRGADKAGRLKALGIEPVIGSLDDRAVIIAAARRSDAVVDTADAEHLYVVDALLAALDGSGKRFIHTSGSSVIGDRAAGEPSDRIFNEDTPFQPLPERMQRVAIDEMVLGGPHRGVHGVVIRPTMIYGRGAGLNPHSLQVPKLIAVARKNGRALHVGRGLNRWSNVHIEDVADAYVKALAEAPAGSLFYLENGEAELRQVAGAISRLLGFGPASHDWPIEDAVRTLGAGAYTSYGSNSRVRADKARRMLGWAPKHDSLLREIESGCYRDFLA
jgi:nucleoside-diphosphate-sugar epimerase